MSNINLRLTEAELDIVVFALEQLTHQPSEDYRRKVVEVLEKANDLKAIHGKFKNGTF